jgi:hypothetical protein
LSLGRHERCALSRQINHYRRIPRPGVTCDRGSWGHTLGRSNTQSEEKAAGASPAYGGRLRLGLAINDGKRTEREVRNCPLKRGRSNRRLRPLRYLHDRPDCYRPERTLPGGSTPHWEIAPFHGARQSRACYLLDNPRNVRGSEPGDSARFTGYATGMPLDGGCERR